MKRKDQRAQRANFPKEEDGAPKEIRDQDERHHQEAIVFGESRAVRTRKEEAHTMQAIRSSLKLGANRLAMSGGEDQNPQKKKIPKLLAPLT